MGGLDRSRAELEDGNVVVDLGPVPLGNALCNPHNVAALLLLQLHEGIEDSEVELVEEGQLVQLYLGKAQRRICQVGGVGQASVELLGRAHDFLAGWKAQHRYPVLHLSMCSGQL